MKKKLRGTGRKGWYILPVLVLLTVFCVYAFKSVWLDVEHAEYPREYMAIVEKQAEAFELDESLVYAVIKAESEFDAEAKSHAGAVGLMQMMPDTFLWMQTKLDEAHDVEALYEPKISIRFGCALLRLLLDQYDDLTVALCAYNAGMGNVTSWLSDTEYSKDGITLDHIPFDETRLYVQKVLRYKKNYENIYGGLENG